MTRLFMAGVAALALSLPAAGAHAVDVINQDAEAYRLTVKDNGEQSLLDVAPRSIMKDVCDACELSLDGEESYEASDDQVAMIKGGRLQIQ